MRGPKVGVATCFMYGIYIVVDSRPQTARKWATLFTPDFKHSGPFESPHDTYGRRT